MHVSNAVNNVTTVPVEETNFLDSFLELEESDTPATKEEPVAKQEDTPPVENTSPPIDLSSLRNQVMSAVQTSVVQKSTPVVRKYYPNASPRGKPGTTRQWNYIKHLKDQCIARGMPQYNIFIKNDIAVASQFIRDMLDALNRNAPKTGRGGQICFCRVEGCRIGPMVNR